jgi:hypothetical protein
MNCISSLVFFSMCCSRSPWKVCTCVERGVGAIRVVLLSPAQHPFVPSITMHCLLYS